MSETTITTLKLEITSDTKSAVNPLEQLIGRLEKLEKVCNGTSKAQDKVSETATKYAERLNAVKNVLNKASNFMKKFTARCGEWFNESNKYVEALNLFEVTMGSGAEQAKRYAGELQNLMGIDIQEWMNYQGSFNQLFEGYGLDNKISNEMSQQLTQIAYDLSSLWNVDVDTAFKKVQSGMSGQIKGLKVWGINLSVAQLKETALAHGIELSTSKMTEAQKATLRYITLMEKTANVQGDLARTIVTPANAMRILEAQTNQAKRALGNIVSVLVTRFIPYMQVAVKWLTEGANKVAALMGYELPEIDYSELDFASSYADDLDESLSDATDSAKKLKKTLLGFDELNVLNSSADASSNILGGGLPSDLGLDLSKYSYDFTQGLTGFDTAAIEEALRKIEIIVSGALLAVGAVLTFTGANIPLGIALMVVGAVSLATSFAIDWNSTNNKVGTVLSVLTGIVGGASLALGALLALTGIATGLGIALIAVGAVTLATSVALNWYSTSDKVNEIIDIITVSISSAMLVIGMILLLTGSNIGLGVALIASGALTLASEIAVDWNTMSSQMQSVITTITSIVSGALLVIGMTLTVLGHYPLGIALLVVGSVGLAATLVLNWDTLKNDLGATIQIIAGVVGGALLVIGAVLAFSGVGIPLGISLMLAGAASLAVSISLNWDSVKSKINKIVGDILAILSAASAVVGILLCFTGVGVPLGIALLYGAYKGTQKASSMSSDGVVKKVKDMINSISSVIEQGVNWIISKLNGLSFDIDLPYAVMKALGFSGDSVHIGFDLSPISIPKLASGGVVNAGQAFIAREKGPELVGNIGGGRTGVMNNDQIVESVSGGVYRAVRDAMSESGGEASIAPINIILTLDGETVYKNTVKRHNDEVKYSGVSPFAIGV